jgi:hypothetical protein
MINALSALQHNKDNKDVLLLLGAVLLYRILMHVKVVLSDSTLVVKCVHQKLSETALAAFAKKCQDVQKLHEHIASHLKSINNVPRPLITTSMLKAYWQISTRPNWSS